MRPFITFLLVLFNLPLAEAQINLVPNPSFEDTVYCPFGLTQIDAAVGWSSYRNSPDYFNSCFPTYPNVPNTSFGYQLAQSGNGFAGIITYYRFNSPAGNNYREYIGAPLLVPLQIGLKYYYSFYAVLAERLTGFSSNNLGLRFFTNQYSLSNPAPLDNFAHLKFDSLLNDSIIWQKISGSFTADSNYNYICIGNFYDYLNTDTLIVTPSANVAYYFIDDICVSTDSIYNETWTGLQIIEQKEINIWPNPSSDFLQFKAIKTIEEILIFDSSSRLIKSVQINDLEGKIDLLGLVQGIYFASFRSEKTISVHKFLKL